MVVGSDGVYRLLMQIGRQALNIHLIRDTHAS